MKLLNGMYTLESDSNGVRGAFLCENQGARGAESETNNFEHRAQDASSNGIVSLFYTI